MRLPHMLPRHAAETFSFELTLDDGAIERVTLANEDDAASEAARVVNNHPAILASAENIELALRQQWRTVMPTQYSGPSPPGGAPLDGLVASVPVSASGLLLDVAESLAAPGAGCGLFVRKANEEGPDVTLFGGQPLCGYGRGHMSDTAVPDGGKTIVFRLDSLQSNVFFRDRLMPLRAVLEEVQAENGGLVGSTAVAIAAHRLNWSDDGSTCTGIEPDPDYTGPYRYFVPDDVDAFSAPNHSDDAAPAHTAMTVGQMCNDLAIAAGISDGLILRPSSNSNLDSDGNGNDNAVGAENEESDASEVKYDAASEDHNFLVLTHRLEVSTGSTDSNDEERVNNRGGVLLVPLAPVLTLTRSLTFTSAVPTELGCKYGYQYWAEALGESR